MPAADGRMHDGAARVLLVEDSPSLAAMYVQYLRHEPYRVEQVATAGEALERLEAEPPHGLLLDLNLPDQDGMVVLERVAELGLPTIVVIITAHGSVDVAVEAMRKGAADFLVKPFDANRLTVTLRNALERQRLSTLVETIRDQARDGYCGFIGSSLAMQAVYRIIDSAAPSRATVFVTGESGTGKEVCAEAVHRMSPRRERPFIALNCGAIPRDLMESEIFGHTKGAFTGATSERKGAAALADGGTLFLDEICEMDIDLQTKLLRFVQTNSFQPVGSGRTERVDVRFVCATNRDPLAEVEAGRFREDLYYRLHVIPIELPPLRERDNDVLAIAEHLLDVYAGEESRRFRRFSRECQASLLDYDWPGNIRQLQNVIRSVVVLNDGEVVTPEMLPATITRGPNARPPAAAPPPPPPAAAHREEGQGIRPLEQVERETIERAIALCEGNIPKAAALLEISASTIYRKRQSWGERA